MPRSRLTVVLSQAQGKNPAKRALEESIVAALLMEPELDVSIVPYLYDLGPDHTGRLFLESITGDMVVLGWIYPRAAFWLLDRDGIKGHFGETQLKPPTDDEDEGAEDETRRREQPADRLVGQRFPIATSTASTCAISTSSSLIVSEMRRIAAECRERREAKRARRQRTARRSCSWACRSHEPEPERASLSGRAGVLARTHCSPRRAGAGIR